MFYHLGNDVWISMCSSFCDYVFIVLVIYCLNSNLWVCSKHVFFTIYDTTVSEIYFYFFIVRTSFKFCMIFFFRKQGQLYSFSVKNCYDSINVMHLITSIISSAASDSPELRHCCGFFSLESEKRVFINCCGFYAECDS